MHNYEYMMRHSYTEVSEFMVPNMHFFMFCLIWFYCLYNTYRFLINKEYSFFYNVLYISIAAVYLIVFFYIVNNLYMRIGVTILAAICLSINMLQHRFNMPSYQESQYSRIRNYLEIDIL